MFSTSAAFATSAATNSASPPAARISSTTRLPRSALRAAITTFAPSRANKIAVALPIPELPPVTNATFPLSLPTHRPCSVTSNPPVTTPRFYPEPPNQSKPEAPRQLAAARASTQKLQQTFAGNEDEVGSPG